MGLKFVFCDLLGSVYTSLWCLIKLFLGWFWLHIMLFFPLFFIFLFLQIILILLLFLFFFHPSSLLFLILSLNQIPRNLFFQLFFLDFLLFFNFFLSLDFFKLLPHLFLSFEVIFDLSFPLFLSLLHFEGNLIH